jgi:hypothetical protein
MINNIKYNINDNIYKCNNNVNKIIKENITYYTNILIKETLNIKLKKYKLQNKKKFICEKCNKNMTNKRNYIIHMENNICEKGKVKISCEKCDRKFTNRRSLKYHMENKVCQKNIYNCCKNNNEIIDNNKIENNEIKDNQIKDNQIKDNEIKDNQINNKNNNENNNQIINNEINNQIIDNENNNEIIDNKIYLNKFKKKSIPLPLKRQVWNTYIGEEIGKAKCLCCKLTDITQLSFSCGHIIPESKGGKLILDNLKPICQSCNSSIGTNNMNDFIQYFGF